MTVIRNLRSDERLPEYSDCVSVRLKPGGCATVMGSVVVSDDDERFFAPPAFQDERAAMDAACAWADAYGLNVYVIRKAP